MIKRRLQNGGKPNFIKRLEDPNRVSIPDWNSNSIATHKMGSASDDKGAFVYPNVIEEAPNILVDYTRPPYRENAGINRAIEKGDTLHFSSDAEARWWARNYKQFYTGF